MAITNNDVWLELSGLNKNIIYDYAYCESQVISQNADLTLDVSYFKTPINVTYKMNGTVIDSYVITTIGNNMHSLIDISGITGVNIFELIATDNSPATKTLKETFTVDIVSTVCQPLICSLTCPTGTKNVGDNVILTLDVTQGVAPYTITYKKNGVIILNGIQIPSNGLYSFTYTTVPIDAGTSPTFSVEVIDSCIPTPQTFVDQCIVTIVEPPKALINIEPPTQSIISGTSFSLNVTIDPQGIPLAGYQFNLVFDSSVITISSVSEGNLLKQGGASTYFYGGTINNTAGTLTNTFCAILGKNSVNTKGVAVRIIFNAIAGTSNLTLFNVKLSTPEGLPILYNINNGIVIISCPVLICSLQLM